MKKIANIVAASSILFMSNGLNAAPIEPSTIPHTFQNGQVANADHVNANFTQLNEKINELAAEMNRMKTVDYSGTYSMHGTEVSLGTCSSASSGGESAKVEHRLFTGTAESNGESIDVSVTRSDYLINTAGGELITESRTETFSMLINANGQLSAPGNPNAKGQITLNGESFMFVFSGVEQEDGCTSAYVGHYTGTKTASDD